jgi:hypothetical protein
MIVSVIYWKLLNHRLTSIGWNRAGGVGMPKLDDSIRRECYDRLCHGSLPYDNVPGGASVLHHMRFNPLVGVASTTMVKSPNLTAVGPKHVWNAGHAFLACWKTRPDQRPLLESQ